MRNVLYSYQLKSLYIFIGFKNPCYIGPIGGMIKDLPIVCGCSGINPIVPPYKCPYNCSLIDHDNSTNMLQMDYSRQGSAVLTINDNLWVTGGVLSPEPSTIDVPPEINLLPSTTSVLIGIHSGSSKAKDLPWSFEFHCAL